MAHLVVKTEGRQNKAKTCMTFVAIPITQYILRGGACVVTHEVFVFGQNDHSRRIYYAGPSKLYTCMSLKCILEHTPWNSCYRGMSWNTVRLRDYFL